MSRFNLKITISLVLMGILASCSNKGTMVIKTGDVLFRRHLESELSQAINDVTQTGKKTNYTHMGVAEVTDSCIWVYHAAPGKGVCRELLKDFQNPESDVPYKVDIYRLHKSFHNNIPLALSKAKRLVGEPYNRTYILEDSGYYCSEYIFHIWANDSVFKTEPMSFKKPGTDEFHQGWINHYTKLGIEIPEGKQGCNPNGMSASSNIFFVMELE